MKILSKVYTILIFLLLYAPMAVMIFFSFNASKSTAVFEGFSLRWYEALFEGGDMLTALKNSLLVACITTAFATVLGTLAAVGIFRMKNKLIKNAVMSVTNIPMMNPDIVTGISLLLFFVLMGAILGTAAPRGVITVIISHITFCLPYVILSVMPKLRQMDKHLTEAALDLGCTPLQAFFKVELPAILPGIISGAVMSFTLSLDDFIISNFTCGQGFQTLPVYIYNMIKKRVSLDVYALYTLIFIAILLLLVLSNMAQNKGDENLAKSHRERMTAHRRAIILKRSLACALAVILVVAVPFAFKFIGGNSNEDFEFIETEYAGTTLYIYNWGEYIANGDDGCLNIEEAFEKTYGIEIIYDTFDSNETMYANLKSGAATYDIVIPSDYMIARMISEDMLQKINLDNIPNYEYIDSKYQGLYYDPNNEYSVPYNVGMIGLIYNRTMVTPEDVEAQSWGIMWDEKYKGNILTFDNARDAFGIAQIYGGMDVNSLDTSDWDRAYEMLVEQRTVLQGYTMDRIFQKMEGSNAAVAAYYAGDCLSMMAVNPDLDFYYPKEGTNIFIDAMCIPANAQNAGAAELFINFILRTDIAVENALYLCYASPNTTVVSNEIYREEMGEKSLDILYNIPEEYFDEDGNLVKAQYYHNLPQEMLSYLNSLWSRLRRN